MAKKQIKNIYYLLLTFLILIGLVVIGVLAMRADQTDKYFEYQKSQAEKNFEGQ